MKKRVIIFSCICFSGNLLLYLLYITSFSMSLLFSVIMNVLLITALLTALYVLIDFIICLIYRKMKKRTKSF